MKICISADKPDTNSLGKPITVKPEYLVSFWRWFGKSRVVDRKKRPIVVYHGTHDDFDTILPNKFGSGTDQYGSGFYTTDVPHVAGGYAYRDYANIMPLYIRIEKPVDNSKKLTAIQIKKLITSSPDYKESLWNYGDWEYEGIAKITNEAVQNIYYSQDNLLRTLNSISNDFWNGIEGKFLQQVNAVCGYDGYIEKNDSGNIYVTWMPDQVKSVFNNGNFYGNSIMAKAC